MISSLPKLKNIDQLLSRNLVVLKTKLNCSSAKQRNEFDFEAPEIFKSTGQDDIVRTRDQPGFMNRMEKNIMDTPTDTNWPDSWPTAQTFDPNRVPLPLYQGAPKVQKTFKTRMARWQNTELIKIPNFLHLTPEAIKRQTDAIRKFCTRWPEELKNEKTLNEQFPITVHTTDRVHAGPSIRDPKARIVTIELNINELELDEHARDKFIKLLGNRYDPKTGQIKIETKDCPFKEQNLELGIYRLTACYFEAWVRF